MYLVSQSLWLIPRGCFLTAWLWRTGELAFLVLWGFNNHCHQKEACISVWCPDFYNCFQIFTSTSPGFGWSHQTATNRQRIFFFFFKFYLTLQCCIGFARQRILKQLPHSGISKGQQTQELSLSVMSL